MRTVIAQRLKLSEEEQSEPLPSKAPVQQNYRDELAVKLQSLSPAGFERFCQRLLRESGFQEVSVTGRSGDGGIDGIGILQVNVLVSFKVSSSANATQAASQ